MASLLVVIDCRGVLDNLLGRIGISKQYRKGSQAQPDLLQLTTTFTFDAAKRLTRLVNGHGEVTTFLYDAAGRETVKLLDNGTRRLPPEWTVGMTCDS
ncbi:MAG: RHS repeat domain-containing protein [Planctomycetaceae bacterium]